MNPAAEKRKVFLSETVNSTENFWKTFLKIH